MQQYISILISTWFYVFYLKYKIQLFLPINWIAVLFRYAIPRLLVHQFPIIKSNHYFWGSYIFRNVKLLKSSYTAVWHKRWLSGHSTQKILLCIHTVVYSWEIAEITLTFTECSYVHVYLSMHYAIPVYPYKYQRYST